MWAYKINDEIVRHAKFAKEICSIMDCYCKKDWCDMVTEIKEVNDKAITYNKRVFAIYETSKGHVAVTTE